MVTELSRTFRGASERVTKTVRKAGSRAVSDRYELLVFLGALLVLSVTWRISFFINDNWVVANTLVAVADGQLHITTFTYGTIEVPRIHMVDGRLYGRNYGQVFLSLPVLILLHALSAVVDLGVGILLAWSGVLFAFATVVGEEVKRRRAAQIVAVAVVLGTFATNTLAPQPLGARARPLMALQLTTMVAAALIAVVVYRLAREFHGIPVGVFAGVATILATPVWFWGTIPKRHSLTALLPLVAIYWFYRSRTATTATAAARFRALAYVPVGLTTWVLAPEGLALFVVLAVIDVLTARSNDPRTLALVGTVFGLAMVPTLATNVAISGNPFTPPIALPQFDGATTFVLDESGRIPVGLRPSDSIDSGSTPGGLPAVAIVTSVAELGVTFGKQVLEGVRSLTDADRMYHAFVRGRTGKGIRIRGNRPLNLSVLESMPLLGSLLAVPAILFERAKDRRWRQLLNNTFDVRHDPRRMTDTLVVVYVTVIVVMYLPRLPNRMMFTVRYLHPIYPLSLYLVVRLRFVRRVIDTEWRLLARSYATLVLLGIPLFLLTVLIITDNPSEAVQLNAALALGAATVLGYFGFVSVLSKTDDFRGGAVALALAGAVTTIFLLLSPFVYFRNTTNFALPISRLVAESLFLW